MDIAAIIMASLALGATLADYLHKQALCAKMEQTRLDIQSTIKALSETHNNLIGQLGTIQDTMATHEMKLQGTKRSVPHFMSHNKQ